MLLYPIDLPPPLPLRPESHRASRSEAREPLPGVWRALMLCESGSDGRWKAQGLFEGGLQFTPTTWSAYAPADYPAHAYEATPHQQVAVARGVLRAQGVSAWPVCGPQVGLTEDS